MGFFLTTLLMAALMVAFGLRLPGPRWLWKTVRYLAMAVLFLGLAFIALMLAFHFFDVKWH
jgi:hypothetical protein